jgi:uncharacterized protein YndB with AHSA1/START domain
MANESLKVEISKDFQVPVERLYKAWNDPEQLKQWWKPMGNQLDEVTNDLKQGGGVLYVFSNGDIVISGEYQEVKPNEKLVYSWDWKLKEDMLRNASYKLTVEFRGSGHGSRLHILQENFENEESMQPHREGWDKGLADLQNFLEGSNSSSDAQSSSSNSSKASAGYGESPEQQKVGGG